MIPIQDVTIYLKDLDSDSKDFSLSKFKEFQGFLCL